MPPPSPISRALTRTVVTFGLVSLLTDLSSEMIYPLLPLFLTTTLGAGPMALGAIEGIAEATAALLKLASGAWSDRLRNRARLVLAGYTLSSLARPFIAMATAPAHVLLVRFADRVGKGVRTTPRDAMLADAVDPSLRGAAYGFQRSMDHVGAILGPLAASALLALWTSDLRAVFWCASVPGIAAVLLILFRVREAPGRVPAPPAPGRLLAPVPPGPLRRYLIVLGLFTLGNSADAFLLLRASQLGVPPAGLPLLWMALHLVKAASTMPLGALSDRVGRRRLIAFGWTICGLTYAGFAAAHAPWHVWGLVAVYGLFFGLTEGAERALMADLAPAGARGGVFGWYYGIVGLGALPASLLFGVLWQAGGAQAAFLFGAGMALGAAALLLLSVRKPGMISAA